MKLSRPAIFFSAIAAAVVAVVVFGALLLPRMVDSQAIRDRISAKLAKQFALEGKKATCYPGHEEALHGAKLMREDVVIDSNIITSRGMGTAIDFSLAIIRKLKGVEEAKRISDQIQYRHYL
jgi:putative intracellular protease/amidase